MNATIITQIIYIVLFIATALAESRGLVPTGTALAVLTGVIIGRGSSNIENQIPTKGSPNA